MAPDSGITREEVDAKFETLRTEIVSGLTTAGVQIGAVEKTLIEKLNGVKLWGALALIGGQAFAALIVKMTGGSVVQPVHTAARALSNFFT